MSMLQPYALTIKNYYSTVGIDTGYPIFAWQLSSQFQEQKQTHYRIVVAQDENSLAKENNLLWDSEQVASEEQLGVMYNGLPLQSTAKYVWKVAVWNPEGSFCWSEPHTFVTGYLDNKEWNAEWIGSGKATPFYARYSFELNKKVKYAFALVSGLGHFNHYMNGSKVGDHEIDPGWTNYQKSVQYVGFDITTHLQSGSNVIGLHLGNGFFAGDSGGATFTRWIKDMSLMEASLW